MDEPQPTDAIIATGGFCAPVETFYRPMTASLPTVTAQRGAITFAKPPEGGWTAYVPPPPPTLRQRVAKRIAVRRVRLGRRLVAIGHRWDGTTCHDEDDW